MDSIKLFLTGRAAGNPERCFGRRPKATFWAEVGLGRCREKMLINVVTFDEEAIYLAKTLNKGDRIFVIGTPRIRAYADSEGCIHERITLISEQVVLMEHQYFECDEDADSRNAKE